MVFYIFEIRDCFYIKFGIYSRLHFCGSLLDQGPTGSDIISRAVKPGTKI